MIDFTLPNKEWWIQVKTSPKGKGARQRKYDPIIQLLALNEQIIPDGTSSSLVIRMMQRELNGYAKNSESTALNSLCETLCAYTTNLTHGNHSISTPAQ